jgi:hypothetical protein
MGDSPEASAARLGDLDGVRLVGIDEAAADLAGCVGQNMKDFRLGGLLGAVGMGGTPPAANLVEREPGKRNSQGAEKEKRPEGAPAKRPEQTAGPRGCHQSAKY